jgi:HEPN domain-containing protein
MNKHADEIRQWIIKADHDLGTAKVTYLHIPEYLDTVTFHCQQSVEKYLKAYLIYLEIRFQFSHDLIYLLDLISQKDTDFKHFYDQLSELQSYAIEVRYPNETIYLTNNKVKDSISISKNIREIVMKKIGLTIDYNEIIDK